ncbi:hypothetical protein Nepgr_023369 [Nepenthes gracilis]|uniref:Uncharacterized protein n=1 Tax=Nepenthes gracilis TaxID=150966 RepID=A0AAD3T3N6_NEPGR|nr:hypothetical protein Nepgr_023369 [Nepenthes gracilis]
MLVQYLVKRFPEAQVRCRSSDLGDAESADDVLVEEFQGIVFCYLSQWDSFNPFGEVIDATMMNFLCRGNGKQPERRSSPHCARRARAEGP